MGSGAEKEIKVMWKKKGSWVITSAVPGTLPLVLSPSLSESLFQAWDETDALWGDTGMAPGSVLSVYCSIWVRNSLLPSLTWLVSCCSWFQVLPPSTHRSTTMTALIVAVMTLEYTSEDAVGCLPWDPCSEVTTNFVSLHILFIQQGESLYLTCYKHCF